MPFIDKTNGHVRCLRDILSWSLDAGRALMSTEECPRSSVSVRECVHFWKKVFQNDWSIMSSHATTDNVGDWFILLVCTTSTISRCLTRGLNVMNYWLLVMPPRRVINLWKRLVYHVDPQPKRLNRLQLTIWVAACDHKYLPAAARIPLPRNTATSNRAYFLPRVLGKDRCQLHKQLWIYRAAP